MLTISRQQALVAALALIVALAVLALLALAPGTPGNGVSSSADGDAIELAVKSRR